MKKLASNLPLQDMIRSVIANATEKLASDETSHGRRVQSAMTRQEEEQVEKTASAYGVTDPSFVEKLASACDMIAANVDNIDTPQVGYLQSALRKQAEEGSPAGPGKRPGALELSGRTGGHQSYKKDKSSTHDAAASTANSPLSAAGRAGGATQLDNTMHSPPGAGDSYPEKGPLVNLNKTARARFIDAIEKRGGHGDWNTQEVHLRKRAPHYEQERRSMESGRTHGARIGAAGGAAGGGTMGFRAAGMAGASKKLRAAATVGGALSGALTGGAVGRGAGGSLGRTVGVMKGPGKKTHLDKGVEKKAGAVGDFASKAFGKAKAVGSRSGELLAGGKRISAGGNVSETGPRAGNALASYAMGKSPNRTEALKSLGARAGAVGAVGASGAALTHGNRDGKRKEASAADFAREHILLKLAGEDVMKANISAGKAGPLPGGSELEVTDASQSGPKQPGDPTSGFGNQGRKHIASITAAMGYTKGDAKGPQKTQLKEVLDEPALSKKTDSVLERNLRNTGKAGVKIAAARVALQKIASGGCACGGSGECSYCQLRDAVRTGQEKKANAMMGYGGGADGGAMGAGGGMQSMAGAGASADGCQCGGIGECRVCKLKAALAAATAQGGMPMQEDPTSAMATMGGGASPMGGQY